MHRDESGITGLETAIILIAFVIVASVFAFVVLSTGLFSAERGKQTVLAGLEKASGNVELRGNVILTDLSDGAISDAEADTIEFNLSLAAGGRPVNLDPTAENNALVINYIDINGRVGNVTFTPDEIKGNDNDLLEVGELASIVIDLSDVTGAAVEPNGTFTLEVIPASGGTLLIERTIPPAIAAVMDLH
jgi:flagellin FlaB